MFNFFFMYHFREGITIKCEVSIPQNCVGYGLCELLRRQMKEKKDLELHGNIYPTQMKLEGNPVSFPLSNNINIENFILKITARKQLFFIEAVAKLIIKEPRIEMKGKQCILTDSYQGNYNADS